VGRIDGGDDLLAVIDTGFNGQLLVSESDIDKLGPGTTRVIAKVEVAGGLVQKVERAYYQVVWMGEVRLVDVFIGLEDTVPKSSDEPIALIGTALLRPHMLLIDFDAGTVEIEGQG
jgi:predicted aspartyl protease